VTLALESRGLGSSGGGSVVELGRRGRNLLPVLVRGNLAGEVVRVSLRLVGVFSGVLGGETLCLLDLLVDSIGSALEVGVDELLVLEINERESKQADIGDQNKSPKRKEFDKEVADQRKSKSSGRVTKMLDKEDTLEF